MPSLRCLRTPSILPGSLTHPHPHPHPHPRPRPRSRSGAASLTLMMLLRLGVARAASKRPASLSAGAPAATGKTTPLRRSLDRPPGAAARPSPEALSEPVRGSSSPPAASGAGGPSLPAAPSAMAGRVSGSQAGDGSGVQPLGNGALMHQEAAPPDFVSPPARGGGGNFLERRHRRDRDAHGLQSRRPAVRWGTAAGVGSRGSSRGEAKRRGGCLKCEENARPARNKRHRAASAAGMRTAGARLQLGDRGRRIRHLPAVSGAAAPGSAAAASTPLCCDREGRLVLTARRDWQASEPLRSLASPERGRPDQSSQPRGVPESEEWNVFL